MNVRASTPRNYIQINKALEAVQASIREEQSYEQLKDPVMAAQVGLKTWVYLKQLMIVLKVNSLYELEHETLFDLLYWADVLTVNLHNAAIKDPEFFQKYYSFCNEFVTMHEQYLEKNVRNLGNIRRALADCYVRQGDFTTCDQLYEQWLNKEPDWGWGWIGWSDSYYLFNGKRKKDSVWAQHLLERGLAVPQVSDRNHINARLQELKRWAAQDTTILAE